jgi:RNA polymerase sigma-70 factor (ECF subfamily)
VELDEVMSPPVMATTELALAHACARGEPLALAQVEAEFFPRIRVALRRMGLAADQVNEAMQAFRTQMFVREGDRSPRIGEYEGRGSLASWLRVSATRLAVKGMRKGRLEVATDDDALFQAVASEDDPEGTCIREECRSYFKAAFQEALESLPGRERTMLRMHVVDGLSIDEIGALYAVHRATAARWVGKARSELLQRTRTGLMRRTRINREDCESMMRLVQSQLGTTMRRRIRAVE